MRLCCALCSAVALFFSPLLAGSLIGQEQPAAQQRPADDGLQVGVPDGRQGAAGRQAGRGRQAGPAAPAPRNTSGRVLLGTADTKQKGVWLPGGGGAATPEATRPEIPFQAWARAVYADRGENQLEPHTRCKPSGAVRQFLTPYGVEFVELPELERIFIFDIGGPHTYRTIYMDGRAHPAKLTPSFYGHSIGWWDGDTLNVETTGYNEAFWIDRRGLPTTEKLRTLETFTRIDAMTINYELTIDDPGAYTAPWSSRISLRWEDGTELFEYQCQQSNYADNLMLGQYESVDRTTLAVP